MTNLPALLSRVENASGPDRGLFIDVMRALGINSEWREDNGKAANDDALLWERVVDLADNDAFIDAAIALAERVLPGAEWAVSTLFGFAHAELDICAEEQIITARRDDRNVARALLAAIIKAKMETQE